MNISLIGAMLPHSIFIVEDDVRTFPLTPPNADRACKDTCKPILYPIEEILSGEINNETRRVILWAKEFLNDDFIKYFSAIGTPEKLEVDIKTGRASKGMYDLLVRNRFNVYFLEEDDYHNARLFSTNPYSHIQQ